MSVITFSSHSFQSTLLPSIACVSVVINGCCSSNNQGCPLICTTSPEPILHLIPVINHSFASQTLLHTKLGLPQKLASRKLLLEKYLALYSFVDKLFGLVRNFHPCFSSMAKLKLRKSLKRSPLATLCFDNLSQL